MAVRKAVKKNTGPTSWEEDDERFPRKYTNCSVCKRYGEMKLSYDLHNWLCLHAGKCIARAFRKEDNGEKQEP